MFSQNSQRVIIEFALCDDSQVRRARGWHLPPARGEAEGRRRFTPSALDAESNSTADSVHCVNMHIRKSRVLFFLLTFPGAPGGPLAPTSPCRQETICSHSLHANYLITSWHCSATITETEEADSGATVTQQGRFSLRCMGSVNRFTLESWTAHETGWSFLYLVSLFTFWPARSLQSSFTLWERPRFEIFPEQSNISVC